MYQLVIFFVIVALGFALSVWLHRAIFRPDHPIRQKPYYPLIAFFFVTLGTFCFSMLLGALWRIVSLRIFEMTWGDWGWLGR